MRLEEDLKEAGEIVSRSRDAAAKLIHDLDIAVQKVLSSYSEPLDIGVEIEAKAGPSWAPGRARSSPRGVSIKVNTYLPGWIEADPSFSDSFGRRLGCKHLVVRARRIKSTE